MSEGRTIWRARDARWYSREWIVILGEEFGADGPSVIAWLEDEAKLQNDGGRVKTGPRAISRGCFVDAVTVGHVVSRSVTLGLLVDYKDLGERFSAVISWFTADQGRAQAADRKRRQRSGATEAPSDQAPVVTVGHAESRPVTECPHTGQDKTEEEATPNGVAVVAAPPLTDLDRQVEQICQEFSDHVRAAHGIAASSKEARVGKGWLDACRAMITIDGLTAEQIKYAGIWVCRHHYWKRRIKSMPRLRSEMSEVAKEIRQQREGGSVVRLSDRKPSAGDLLEEIHGGTIA